MIEKQQVVEQVLISGRELAAMLSLSPRWVELNRHRILGATRVGGVWRFNAAVIRSAIASGKNIVLEN
jgi:hypothetical protein